MATKCPLSCFSSISSLQKKYLMALTGLVLAGFVFFHMLGNLQMFLGPDPINAYAHFLKSLPASVLWGLRSVLIVSALLHTLLAIVMTIENKQAHNAQYAKSATIQATCASATMGITGSLILFFVVFHLLHFTLHLIHPEYGQAGFLTMLSGEYVLDVYRMVIDGFCYDWVAILYIVAMFMLCKHLSHGISSLFQSLGLRTMNWKAKLERVAVIYGVVIFLGFIATPAAVLVSKYTSWEIFPVNQVIEQRMLDEKGSL